MRFSLLLSLTLCCQPLAAVTSPLCNSEIKGQTSKVKNQTFLASGSQIEAASGCSVANRESLLGAAAGAVGVYMLSLILKFLLSQQSNVNWSVHDAIMEKGTVYLRIPAGGEGLVRVNIKGAKRELKARSKATEDIPTGAPIVVDEIGSDGIVVVSPT